MVEQLKLFGLNSYEGRAYETLLREGASTAHFISKKAGVPSGKIYPVLDSLVEKGFILLSGGKPKIFISISPEIILEKVIKRKKKELNFIEENAHKLIESYSKLRSLKDEKEHELVEAYFGHSSAFLRSITLHNQTKKYWKTISNLTLNKDHLDACSSALKRGVQILAITDPNETTSERVKQWEKIGVEVRFLEDLPFRVSIYDDKGVVFRFSHEKSKQYVSMHIINTKLASGMSKLFDNLLTAASKKPPIHLK